VVAIRVGLARVVADEHVHGDRVRRDAGSLEVAEALAHEFLVKVAM
jgi:hypothetical protein